MKKFVCYLMILSMILSMVLSEQAPFVFAVDSNYWPPGGETVVVRENLTTTAPGVFEMSSGWGIDAGTYKYPNGTGAMKTSSAKSVSSKTVGSTLTYWLGTFAPGDYYAWFFFNPGANAENDIPFNYEIGSSNAGPYETGTNNQMYPGQTLTKDWMMFTQGKTGPAHTLHFSGNGMEYIKVTVTDSTQYLRMGAVRLSKPVEEYVVNVTDPGFSKAGSGWGASANYICNGLWPITTGWKTNATGLTATYDFKGIAPKGTYDVYFYQPDALANNPNSQFIVRSGDGTTQTFPFTTWSYHAWVKVNDVPVAFNDTANEASVQVQTGGGGNYTRIGAIKLVQVGPTKPVASDVSVLGDPLVGSTLQGSYTTFKCPEGSTESGSTATWSRADDSGFTTNVVPIKTEPISAGITSNYTLTNQDDGKYIKFSVVPRSNAADNNVGDEASSILSSKIRVPQTVPIVNLTSPRDGYRVYVGNDINMSATAVCDNTTITKIEYYANNIKCTESSTSPYLATWSGAAVGDYSVFARAYNALGEHADSAVINMRVADLSERTDPVWAKKWGYDFNQFTNSNTFDSTTGLTFPGTLPPTINISTGGTVQSAHGLFGKSADDYHLQINSISGNITPATLKFDISSLDNPINNVVAQMDIAFSTTNEKRYAFTYRTPGNLYSSLVFYDDGKIKYTCKSGTFAFKDDNGNDLTYQANKWYNVAVKYDFVNKTIMYYIDGKKLNTVDEVPSSPIDFLSISELEVYGTHGTTTGIMYVDNLYVGQEQDFYVTSVLSSPLQGYNLKGSAIKFEGYAKDANGKAISKVEFYANNSLIAEKTGSNYSFTLSNLPCGNYDVFAKAINVDGEEGISKTVHIVVDGIFLPKMYSDGMLLQRNKPIKIAGTGIDGVTVTAALNGSTVNAVVANGQWQLMLPAQAATKSTTLTISTSEGVTTIFKDVAIGELIMCSGQSNMAYTIGYFPSLVPEADKTYDDIRMFDEPIIDGDFPPPQTDIPLGYWTHATPSAAYMFSAVGFLTGKYYYLSQNGQVPIGLIKGAVGGTTINRWVESTAYDHDPDLYGIKSNMSNYFNRMIYPWKDFTIGTVLWYQGESDTQLIYNYEKRMTALIKSWRAVRNDNINFVVVQLPIWTYKDLYSCPTSAVGVRAGQFNVSKTLDNVASVIAIDCGSAAIGSVHPADKQPIAKRCALAVQHFANPTDTALIWKSPSYDHFVQQGNQMTIYFNDVAGGLKTLDGLAPRGFKIAGDDGKFVDTNVTLSGNTIIVDTSSVTGTPKVRYAWEDCPALVGTASTVNLVNSAELPMAPFKTDNDRYHFKSEDKTTTPYTFYDPVNFTPSVLSVTADSSIKNNQVTISVNAKDYDDDVAKVDVYADGILLGEATRMGTTDVFKYQWVNPTTGTHLLHAIATDTTGCTSIKCDPSVGTTSIAPQKFSVTLANAPQYSILPFEDLSGKAITYFGGENGVTAKAEISSGAAYLVLAAYNGNTLINMKMSTGNSVSFTSAELLAATKVKAFLFNNMSDIMPLTNPSEICKTQ